MGAVMSKPEAVQPAPPAWHAPTHTTPPIMAFLRRGALHHVWTLDLCADGKIALLARLPGPDASVQLISDDVTVNVVSDTQVVLLWLRAAHVRSKWDNDHDGATLTRVSRGGGGILLAPLRSTHPITVIGSDAWLRVLEDKCKALVNADVVVPRSFVPSGLAAFDALHRVFAV
jgi:hypothetical protein